MRIHQLACTAIANFILIVSVSSQRLEAYFDRLDPAQPAINLGGMVRCIAVNPSNDNEVIAATHTGGLMKTTDQALSWRTIFSLPPHVVMFVEYAPQNTNHIIAATIDYYSVSTRGGIWLSRNGGTTWEQPRGSIPTILRPGVDLEAYCIATYPGSTRILAATNYGLAISNDNGVNWTYMSVPGTTVGAVALTRGNRMLISTPLGIFYRNEAGTEWTRETTGIGMAYGPNSFYVPKHFMSDVPTNNPVLVVTSSRNIMLSYSGGSAWTRIDTTPILSNGAKGTLFVRMARPGIRIGSLGLPLSPGDGIDLYTTDLLNVYRKFCRRTGSNFSYDFTGPWEAVPHQHTDFSDLAVDRSGNAYLAGGDGGIQRYLELLTGRFGFIGGGHSANGLHGLQITEISGMLISSTGNIDLYFSTQDNNVHASDDLGSRWNYSVCCEGFFLEHARKVSNVEEADLGFVTCGACVDKISGRLFSGQRSYIPPAGTDPGALKYLNTNTWLASTYTDNARPGVAPTVATVTYYYTSNYTSPSATPGWTRLSTLNSFVPRGLPRKHSDGDNHVIYQAYKAVGDGGDDVGGAGGAGIQRVKLMRLRLTAEPHFYYSEPRYPAMRNFGSLGVFPTEFAWYEVFEADPQNPQHIIAADALNNTMKRSLNGGDDWTDMTNLTNLVTGGGTFKFKNGRLTNVSCIRFNPTDNQMVLVGTRNSGIFFSWNNGTSWEKIPGSERIPEVSSFYFQNNNTVWVSSYGRGLWKLNFTFRARRPVIFNFCENSSACYTLLRPDLIALLAQNNVNAMEFDRAMMVADGSITGIRIVNGVVEAIEHSPDASVVWYTDEKLIRPVFKIQVRDSIRLGFHGDNRIGELVDKGYIIKGILTKGNQLVDIVYGKEPSPFPDKPLVKNFVEVGAKELETAGKPFILLSAKEMTNGHCMVSPGEKLILRGINFDKTGPLPRVFMDGEPSTRIKIDKLDDDGSFYVEFDAPETRGYHTVTVTQFLANQKWITQTDEFMVRHIDEPHKETPPEQIKEKKEPEPIKKNEKQIVPIQKNEKQIPPIKKQ